MSCNGRSKSTTKAGGGEAYGTPPKVDYAQYPRLINKTIWDEQSSSGVYDDGKEAVDIREGAMW